MSWRERGCTWGLRGSEAPAYGRSPSMPTRPWPGACLQFARRPASGAFFRRKAAAARGRGRSGAVCSRGGAAGQALWVRGGVGEKGGWVGGAEGQSGEAAPPRPLKKGHERGPLHSNAKLTQFLLALGLGKALPLKTLLWERRPTACERAGRPRVSTPDTRRTAHGARRTSLSRLARRRSSRARRSSSAASLACSSASFCLASYNSRRDQG